ncbi:unnamed protein product [Caenorhabditis brenneri]
MKNYGPRDLDCIVDAVLLDGRVHNQLDDCGVYVADYKIKTTIRNSYCSPGNYRCNIFDVVLVLCNTDDFIVSCSDKLLSLNQLLFSVLFTKYITLCVFVYTCIIITLFFGILGCENYYNPEVVAFSYSSQPICKVFALYGDFYEVLSLTVIGAAMDLVTIWKVLQMRIKTEKGKKDLNFLKQVRLTCFMFCREMFFSL